MQIISSSEQKTRLIAKKFARRLKGGEVIGLIGNLGAGKTIFTKGLAAGLGIKKNLTSPTFVLMKVYPVAKHESIKFLIHIDAYRIKSGRDLAAIGINEYTSRPDTVTIIEWADKIKKVLPRKTRLITITYQDNSRVIKF